MLSTLLRTPAGPHGRAAAPQAPRLGPGRRSPSR